MRYFIKFFKNGALAYYIDKTSPIEIGFKEYNLEEFKNILSNEGIEYKTDEEILKEKVETNILDIQDTAEMTAYALEDISTTAELVSYSLEDSTITAEMLVYALEKIEELEQKIKVLEEGVV